MSPIVIFFVALMPGILILLIRSILIRVAVISLRVRAWLFNFAMIALVLAPTFSLGVDFTEGSPQPAGLMCGSLLVMAIAIRQAIRERRIVNYVLEFSDSGQQANAEGNGDKADFHENMMYVKRLEIIGGVADLKSVGLEKWEPAAYAERAQQAR